MRRFGFLFAGLAGMTLTAAAPVRGPAALAGVQPGLWETSRSATGQGAHRVCLRDMVLLATYAHAGDRCARTMLVDRPGFFVMQLDCGAGDFGRSRLSVTTPRSLKIESQGFHRGEPYDLTIYARRVGECPSRRRR
ncbi:hypothetical protein [Sphingomonas sp. LHG3406-1]|uniref:hypothetical protein n=1 Tax=Sphingomonas sp. LHG3406-1 TaxID=2804617 RepID=UPI00261A07FB|nr:hypothetical protein [Sphingomonas sp. LHG3406-1]